MTLPFREVPQNIQAEESVLGAILLDPVSVEIVAGILPPDAFSIQAHRTIYSTCLTLASTGKPTDLMTVTTYLHDRGKLNDVGGQAKLAQLVDRTVSSVNCDGYALLILEKFLKRKLIQAGEEITDLGYAPGDFAPIYDLAEQKLSAIGGNNSSEELVPISDTLIEAYRDLENRQAGLETPGYKCDFYDLDGMTGGFGKSDLIIVAGRPSMGKTAFAVQVAEAIAKNYGKAIAMFSIEMGRKQVVTRMLASRARVESNRLRTGQIYDREWDALGLALGELSELPIFINDSPVTTVTAIKSQCRKLIRQRGELGLILVDYLQLMEGDEDNRVHQLSKMTRGLKLLARELDVPVMALSQLSRSVENRADKRPMMSDLRDSGCLTGDSLVTLADSGLRVPIRELVGRSGFAVWSLNESTMKLERAIVTNAFFTGVKPVFRLTTQLGRTIKATGNHKFLTINGWKRLDELTPGMHLALPRTLPSSSVQSMSDAELALLGHLIGDGCTLPQHAIQYTTGEEDLAYIVASLATEVFGDKIKPRINKERNWYQVYLPAAYRLSRNTRNPITEWLDAMKVFGLRSYEKFVPEQVFEQPQEAIALFLRNLWSTDGFVGFMNKECDRPIAYYASSSKKLSRNVQSLLLRLGINARLSVVSQTGKGRDQHHVTITGKSDIERFVALIGAVGTRRKQVLSEIAEHIQHRSANTNRDVIPHDIWRLYVVPSMQRNGLTARQMQEQLGGQYRGESLFDQNVSRDRAARLATVVKSDTLSLLSTSDIYWDKIVSIEANGEAEVYDLTVPVLHNFIANDTILHNSIEQDGDLILMLYRDEYYNPNTADRGIAEIILVKHRNGPTGTVKMLFDSQYTMFRNLARRD